MCERKTLRQHDQAIPRLARLGGYSFLDRRIIMDPSKRNRHPERWGGGQDRAVEQWSERRRVGVEDDGDPLDTRRDLVEQLEPFSQVGSSCTLNPVMFPPGRARL